MSKRGGKRREGTEKRRIEAEKRKRRKRRGREVGEKREI